MEEMYIDLVVTFCSSLSSVSLMASTLAAASREYTLHQQQYLPKLQPVVRKKHFL
jgi:hypothetical protein